jgi:nucleoside-diphosphate-sugar epimerase
MSQVKNARVGNRHLREARPNATLHGYDTAFFGHCLTGATVVPERMLDRQFYGDVRQIPPNFFRGYDAVVQLAAISNDPMGSRFADVTRSINHESTISIAAAAANAGVANFVFASSCSVYGVAEGRPRKEADALNPISAYAKSKIDAERDLKSLDTGMTITALRFATACGMSDRLRLDLVLNDFVAGAVANGEITILSDGSPWRPLIDTMDMARAIDWAIDRPAETGGRFLAVNVGSSASNMRVKDIAAAVVAAIPGVKLGLNPAAPIDSRSYQVDFSLFQKLAPKHQPQVTLQQSIEQLRDGLTRMRFADRNYRSSQLMRLAVLESHVASGRLSGDLQWKLSEAA